MLKEKLTLKDKPLIDSCLSAEKRGLAVYSFENIYIWSGLFDIYLTELAGYLLVFFEDASGCFLYLPPLGPKKNGEVIAEAFRIMDARNGKRTSVSRIENICEEDIPSYEALGYSCVRKSCDYLCLRESIAGYRGEKFKHKRSAANHFMKHNAFEYLPFSKKDSADCLALYDLWAGQRRQKIKDRIYNSLLDDNRSALEVMLGSYGSLNMEGRVVRISGKVKAFTFGYGINSNVFAVLYEVTDLSFKGLSQFIFSRFASELTHEYLNIMDDSGLENLRKAKLSFHPEKSIPAYIAVREKASSS